jgi:hypothetical protein
MDLLVVSVLARPTELGGRRSRIPSGYLADVACDGRQVRAWVLCVSADPPRQGSRNLALMRLADPGIASIDVGKEIRFLEGGREVAAGSVLAVTLSIEINDQALASARTDPMEAQSQPDSDFIFVPLHEFASAHATETFPAERASLVDLVLPRGEVRGLTIAGEPYRSIVVKGTTIVEATFADATVAFRTGMKGDQAVFRDCGFSASKLELGNARFERCTFENVRLPAGVGLAEFVDCSFRGELEGVRFEGSPPAADAFGRVTNEFRGNDFSGALMPGCAFRHVNLGAQRWPADDRCHRVSVRQDILAEVEDQLPGEFRPDDRYYIRWLRDYYGDQAEIMVWIDDRTPAARFWRLLIELAEDAT